MAPADLLHGVLAWSLLALIAGHVNMVLIHRHHLKDDTLTRMLGPAPPSQPEGLARSESPYKVQNFPKLLTPEFC
jgi:hypothetical protein